MTEKTWHRADYDAFQAGLSPERKAADAALLQRILDAAAEVPTLKEELAWARAHGVEFFVDRTAVNVSGYYTHGTGVLGISAAEAEKNFDYIVGTLAHEIRHAWQDWNDLRKRGTSDFASYYISDALIEADAHAYGERVRAEYKALKLTKEGQPIPADLQTLLDDKEEHLRKGFLSWYANPGKTRYYGEKALRLCFNAAVKDPAKKVEPVDHKYEFKHGAIPKPPTKLGITGIKDVLPLGQDFSGSGNYLAGIPSETWLKRILRPALAYTFWGAANDNQRKMAVEVRKENARARVAAAREKRQPKN